MSSAPWVRRVFPVVPNYRGKPVGVWLGSVATAALLISNGAMLLAFSVGDRWPESDRRRLLWILVGIAVVFVAGFYDDSRPARTRGIVRQVRALLSGRLSSGVVKVMGILAASAFVGWMLGARGWRLVIGTAVMAGAANLWNLLDVVPGRALKWFLPSALVLAIGGSGHGEYLPLAASAIAVGAAALFFDLMELAMLGDSGSNVLGFVIGAGLFVVLPTAWMAAAFALILVLHVVSETVTLSRVIEAVPPLRWFDGLGRRRARTGSKDDVPREGASPGRSL